MIEIRLSEGSIAVRIWTYTALLFVCGLAVYALLFENGVWQEAIFLIPIFIGTLIGSSPALLILWFCLSGISKKFNQSKHKWWLLFVVTFLITLLYGAFAILINSSFSSSEAVIASLPFGGSVTGLLFLSALLAIFINYKPIQTIFFSDDFLINQLNTTDMQQDNLNSAMQAQTASQPHSLFTQPNSINRTAIKAGITAALILLMLIPVNYIQSLITERKERQEQIVDEVSGKWAASQTVTPPYLVIPYKNGDTTNKKETIKQLVILPEQVSVKGVLEPEQRHRSNYDVLLYRSQLHMAGEFKISLPKNITTDKLLLQEAKICTGISDFKGIEKKVVIHFDNSDITLSPGLPLNIDSSGLSAPVDVPVARIATSIPFNLSLQLKGSNQLHFKPMSGNSSFELNSSWPHPSFDGNVIPVKDDNATSAETSFPARWNFSNANLPFTTVLQNDAIKNYDNLAFGVSLIQPADQYVQSMRSIKYAILVIGLTFALFFIVEILQKNPVHPVQYVLIGLALTIFYSLLISISEFIAFNQAYIIAATATVLLITLYTKSHFKTWKTAGIFFLILSGLYGFIFILISLEDTALLTGSIALFIVLSIVMYASRKINWYQPAIARPNTQASSSI